ncbi:hypothetical protein BN1051_02870 [Arthrobacter saudimassiliensis]|uniref:DUF1684 domain-containing protein n=1 Tax=Arthrobacter saudimassiliensis TaxID=1461584 RepID=A0A078MT55_9MICC|nr:hypothetical protein BN1051_02870 [Arthrobacter saudimassiliensis]
MVSPLLALHTADWRLRVFELYARVREAAADSPPAAHRIWREGRDRLFADHPASPLSPAARADFGGLAVAPYDPWLRVQAVPDDDGAGQVREVPTGTDGTVRFERLGTVAADGVGRLALWRLASYGGGLFLPLHDGTSGRPAAEGGSYGGGRYLLDTIKGAFLGAGAREGSLILDFNFLYNPSCAYDPAWACPLPGPENRVPAPVTAGELAAGY